MGSGRISQHVRPTFCSITNSFIGSEWYTRYSSIFPADIQDKQTIRWLTALSKPRMTRKHLGDCGQTACLLSTKQEQQPQNWQSPYGKSMVSVERTWHSEWRFLRARAPQISRCNYDYLTFNVRSGRVSLVQRFVFHTPSYLSLKLLPCLKMNQYQTFSINISSGSYT